MKKKTVVEGYTIIKRERAGETMIVIGHNPKAMQPYVTWKAYKFSKFESFNYGHYFSTRKDAMVDFHERLAEVWEYFTPTQAEPPAPKKPRKDEPPTR